MNDLPCFWHWIAFMILVTVASTTSILDDMKNRIMKDDNQQHQQVAEEVSTSTISLQEFCSMVSLLSLVGLPIVVAQYSLINWLLNRYCKKWKVQANVKYTFHQFKLEVFWTIPTFWTVVALFYYLYLNQDSIQRVDWESFLEAQHRKSGDAGGDVITDGEEVILSQLQRAYWIEAVGRTLLFFAFFDFFEYVVHRGFHEVPFLYRQVHKVHHQYSAPSMLTGLAFHPIEALLFFLPVLGLFYWPTHPTLLNIIFIFFNLIDLVAHAGFYIPVYESLTGGFIDTTKHHDYHHQNFTPNYGVYFCIWDRILGTAAAALDSSEATRKKKL